MNSEKLSEKFARLLALRKSGKLKPRTIPKNHKNEKEEIKKTSQEIAPKVEGRKGRF